MTGPLLLLLGGLALSFLASGVETGFYRVTRVRLVLGALRGGRRDRWLLKIANHPGLFVATTLIANIAAADLVSIATVGLVHVMFGEGRQWAEILGPILLTPLAFVYGDLLPKHSFYIAPYKLLHRVSPIFLAITVALLPLSAVLWLLSEALGKLLGQETGVIRSTLAARELRNLLDEGREAGVLHPAQRNLAQSLFLASRQTVSQAATPLGRLVRGRSDGTREQLLELCRSRGVAWLPIEAQALGEVMGYVRAIDLRFSTDARLPIRPLVELPAAENKILALVRLHDRGEEVARVVSDDGRTLGIVTVRQLSEPLFREQPAVG